MEKYYKISFMGGIELIVKDYKDLKSLKLSLDRFTIFLKPNDEQVLINTASITHIEEVEVNG